MTKRQDLCLQRRSRPEQSDQRQANQPADISHQPKASPDSTSLASRIEFPTMTTGFTSSVTILNRVSFAGPKLVEMATSAASGPRAKTIRPILGMLRRASKVHQPPSR